MSLDTYALTSVDDIKAYLGSLPSRDGLWIYCSQGDATAATVEITATAMVLIITGGAQAGTNTLTFADANKDTLAELVTAINALTGWKAGAIYDGLASSTDLVVIGATSCLGAANELTLKIEDNYLIERLIDRATYFLERYCHRKFLTRTYSREVYYGNGQRQLLLDQYPVTAVSRVSIGRLNAFSITNTTATNHASIEITATGMNLLKDGVVATTTFAPYATINLFITALTGALIGWQMTLLNSSYGTRKPTELLIRPAMYCLSPTLAYAEIPNDELTDYYLINPTEDRNYGVLECPGGWTKGEEYFIDYTAGYSTVPIDLEDACIRLVVNRYNQSKKDGSIKSENLGDYGYTMADLRSLPDDLKDAVNLYRKILL